MGPTGWVARTHCIGPRFNNRDIFASTASADGCRLSPAGLDSPESEEIGHAPRRNGVVANVAQKVIRETMAIGKSHIHMVLTETVGFGKAKTSAAKKVQEKKNGERDLKFEECSPEIQTQLRNTRTA